MFDVINKAGIKSNPSTGLHLSTAIIGTAIAIIDYAIGLEKLSANEGFFVGGGGGAQMAVNFN